MNNFQLGDKVIITVLNNATGTIISRDAVIGPQKTVKVRLTSGQERIFPVSNLQLLIPFAASQINYAIVAIINSWLSNKFQELIVHRSKLMQFLVYYKLNEDRMNMFDSNFYLFFYHLSNLVDDEKNYYFTEGIISADSPVMNLQNYTENIISVDSPTVNNVASEENFIFQTLDRFFQKGNILKSLIYDKEKLRCWLYKIDPKIVSIREFRNHDLLKFETRRIIWTLYGEFQKYLVQLALRQYTELWNCYHIPNPPIEVSQHLMFYERQREANIVKMEEILKRYRFYSSFYLSTLQIIYRQTIENTINYRRSNVKHSIQMYVSALKLSECTICNYKMTNPIICATCLHGICNQCEKHLANNICVFCRSEVKLPESLVN